MKNKAYLFFALALTLLSGCIKVEDSLIKCSNPPAAPKLLVPSYSTTNGSTVGLILTNSSSDVGYTVTAPGGLTFEYAAGEPVFVPISQSAVGTYTYKVSAVKNFCAGPATEFTVVLTNAVISCGIANNNIVLYGNSTYPVSSAYASNYGSYYQMQWDLPSNYTRTFTLYFKQLPPVTDTTYYTVVSNTVNTLQNNTVRAEYYYSGSTYASTGGSMAVTYSNGSYKATFCNIAMRDVEYSYITTDAKGVLLFRP